MRTTNLGPVWRRLTAGHVRPLLGLTLISVLLLLSACSSGGDGGDGGSAGAENVTGGDVEIGLGSMPPTLDPYTATSPPRSFIVGSIYSFVTTVDTTGEEVETTPNVAESWEQVDPVTWEFTVKEGLEFPNGEPLDANAVVSSLTYVLDPANNKEVRSKLAAIDHGEVVDDLTFRVVTKGPEPILPRLLGAMPVVPPKAFAEMGEAAYLENPIATGPFKVEEFVPENTLRLVPNEASAGGPPAADSLTFTVIPEAAARVAALRSGSVDAINQVPIDQVGSIESEFEILDIVDPSAYLMDLYTDEGPLADPKVRQALNYAVDKQAIVDSIMGGLGQPLAGQLVPEGVTGYCPDVTAYSYDVETANQLMAEAGVSGLKLTMQTSNGFIVNDHLVAQAVAEMLQQLDAVESVDIEVMEFTNYLDVYYGRAERADLYGWRASAAPFLDASVQVERFTEATAAHPTGYVNPDYEAAFEKMRQSADEAERNQAFCDMSTVLKEDAPVLYLVHPPDVWAASGSVGGLQLGRDGNPTIATVAVGN